MSLFEFKLPDIGEGVMEGEIVAWLVEAGQSVSEDEPMVEVMTDKATVTIGAPSTGTVQELFAGVGEVVAVGSVIVTLQSANGAAAVSAPTPAASSPAPASSPVPAKAEPPAATAVGDIKESVAGASLFQQSAQKQAPVASAAVPAQSGYYADKPLATPATRRLARDLDVDLHRVVPTGKAGRVSKDDVQLAADSNAADSVLAEGASTLVGQVLAPAAEPAAVPAPAASKHAPISIVPPSVEEAALEERTPFVGIRRKIAERMQRSTQTAAHFTFVEECDVAKLKELRARLKPAAEAAGVKLSFLPFIVKAVVAALKKHPVLNSALDESKNELVTRRYHHIGIAASTDQGLMVPVVKHADRLSILDIAREIDRLGKGAKSGTLATADLVGSTFTITSLGKQGGLFATPILNFPEVGILGVHQIKQKPVVRDGAIEIGEVMLLSLSFDHRIVDGHVGAAFAYDIIGYLEDPDRLFLEMA